MALSKAQQGLRIRMITFLKILAILPSNVEGVAALADNMIKVYTLYYAYSHKHPIYRLILAVQDKFIHRFCLDEHTLFASMAAVIKDVANVSRPPL
jgi:hypothetical protein